jgi:hypothetical protein
MRALLEIYRWVTLLAFAASGGLLLLRLLVPLALPALAPGIELNALSFVAALAIGATFAVSGFNVIMIAIYDQLRTVTVQIEHTRTEIASLRDDLRARD